MLSTTPSLDILRRGRRRTRLHTYHSSNDDISLNIPPSICLPPFLSDEGEFQFNTRTSFINVDDYARYMRDNVAVGMMVRCCEASNVVQKEDVGGITKVR